MPQSYTIRKVTKADLNQLFSLLCDLTQHEGNAQRFKMTLPRLERELFGPQADWHCLIAADHDDKAIGFCLYTFANINRAFNTSPMIQVDDLYICPSYRQQGIGKALFYELALIAKEKNIGRLNIWCIKDNQLGQRFYKQLGAEKENSSIFILYRLNS